MPTRRDPAKSRAPTESNFDAPRFFGAGRVAARGGRVRPRGLRFLARPLGAKAMDPRLGNNSSAFAVDPVSESRAPKGVSLCQDSDGSGIAAAETVGGVSAAANCWRASRREPGRAAEVGEGAARGSGAAAAEEGARCAGIASDSEKPSDQELAIDESGAAVTAADRSGAAVTSTDDSPASEEGTSPRSAKPFSPEFLVTGRIPPWCGG
jgi:hypothetical protein